MEGRAHRVLVAIALMGVAATAGIHTQSVAASARSGQATACVYDHLTLWTAPGTCRPRARVYPMNVKGKVRRAIYDSSLVFGMPYAVLLAIARCESGLNPHAAWSGHYGLFQFAPPTFQGGARDLERQTGIVAHSYWSPLDSAYVAGYLFATGKAQQWGCERRQTANALGQISFSTQSAQRGERA